MDTHAANFTQSERLEILFREHQGYLRRRQVVDAGIDPHLLSTWVRQGRAERVQRGIYRYAQAPPLTDESLLEVAMRVPQGVICLRSALAFHGLGTISPSEIDLAIPNKARRPSLQYPPVNFYYFSNSVYSYGIEEHKIGPVTAKVYTPEKTLADLLYYRNKLGHDIFMEGLQSYMSKPDANAGSVMQAARVRRVHGLMHSYLEALA